MSEALPTQCMKCGATAFLTIQETLQWMNVHPAKCKESGK